ncbi:MAG: TIGR01777 family oxidoreductase [Deltaproteobacteria bacterium]|nr:TIGR01777 family oxidoreductase [Deltaproteobacteria bacterium]
MRYLITGATGFVGTALCRHLITVRRDIIALGRQKEFRLGALDGVTYVRANTMMPGDWQQHVETADVIVNLAGESILQRWSDYKRSRMWKSRVYTTRNLLTHMRAGQTLVNISATGYYGDCGATVLDESAPCGNGFLSDLCRAWEADAQKAEEKGARVVIARLGVVLGAGGALEKMLPVFRLGMGGRLGSGHQWMPWIHMDDVTRALVTMAESSEIRGIFNLVAPNPVTNRKFTETLGNVLNRPTLAPVPQMVLNIIFGEASRVMLDSQRAQPRGLLESGYVFQYADLHSALTSLIDAA